MWDGTQLLQEKNAATGAEVTRYLLQNSDYTGLRTQRHASDNVWRYFVTDLQGSTRLLINSDGTNDLSLLYRAFGQKQASSGAGSTLMQFGAFYGYEWDADSRMWVKARHLSGTQGRWLSQDPIGYKGGGWNLFRYVGNNPIIGFDPKGLYGPMYQVVPEGYWGRYDDPDGVYYAQYIDCFRRCEKDISDVVCKILPWIDDVQDKVTGGGLLASAVGAIGTYLAAQKGLNKALEELSRQTSTPQMRDVLQDVRRVTRDMDEVSIRLQRWVSANEQARLARELNSLQRELNGLARTLNQAGKEFQQLLKAVQAAQKTVTNLQKLARGGAVVALGALDLALVYCTLQCYAEAW